MKSLRITLSTKANLYLRNMTWLNQYLSSYKGFSREVWVLAFITLVNRAGTMVIPFLSLYLTNDQGFSLDEVGWVMTYFGLGSVAGSWLGGKLTDVLGAYKVMAASLLGSALLFVVLQYLDGIQAIRLGIFFLMVVADMFRPAMFVALRSYSKPENRTRSVTLIRLAINLGFSAGPAFGGLIIASVGYGGLFWVDGLTCLIAGVILLRMLSPRKSTVIDENKVELPLSPYSDGLYLVFLLAMAIFGVVFLQFFSTVPVFYNQVAGLSEYQIGILMAINGLFIFVFEMPLVKFLDKPGKSKMWLIMAGTVLVGLSYFLLNVSTIYGVLVLSILFLTLGEMVAFPFSNAFAMDRAKRGKQGAYMALYSIAFSISHIFAHNAGFHAIDKYGYETAWYGTVVLAIICIALLVLVMTTERAQTNTSLFPEKKKDQNR